MRISFDDAMRIAMANPHAFDIQLENGEFLCPEQKIELAEKVRTNKPIFTIGSTTIISGSTLVFSVRSRE